MDTITPKAAITFILSVAIGILTYMIFKSVLAILVSPTVIAILDRQSIKTNKPSKV